MAAVFSSLPVHAAIADSCFITLHRVGQGQVVSYGSVTARRGTRSQTMTKTRHPAMRRAMEPEGLLSADRRPVLQCRIRTAARNDDHTIYVARVPAGMNMIASKKKD